MPGQMLIPLALVCALFPISELRVVNAELLKVGIVLRWVIVKLFQLWFELLHEVFVQPDGRFVLGTEEGGVLRVAQEAR